MKKLFVAAVAACTLGFAQQANAANVVEPTKPIIVVGPDGTIVIAKPSTPTTIDWDDLIVIH